MREQVLDEDCAKVLMRQGAGRFHFMRAIAVFMVTQGVQSINDSKSFITAKENLETEITDKMVVV